jgi:hypothetical protein
MLSVYHLESTKQEIFAGSEVRWPDASCLGLKDEGAILGALLLFCIPSIVTRLSLASTDWLAAMHHLYLAAKVAPQPPCTHILGSETTVG